MNDPQLEPQWRYSDLRDWLRETDKLGELKTVLGASRVQIVRQTVPLAKEDDDGKLAVAPPPSP